VPPVPNEAFRISLQLLLKGLDNGLAILLILPGLSKIQADNVTTILNPYLLNLEGRGVVNRFSFRTDFPKATPTGEHFFSDLFHPAHPGSKDIRNLSLF